MVTAPESGVLVSFEAIDGTGGREIQLFSVIEPAVLWREIVITVKLEVLFRYKRSHADTQLMFCMSHAVPKQIYPLIRNIRQLA
jgi:hypothetical protein